MHIDKNIDYDKFLQLVEKYQKSVKDWRYGQAYFNILSSVRPELAELIRGSMYDPFHKDEVSDQIHTYIKSKWARNG